MSIEGSHYFIHNRSINNIRVYGLRSVERGGLPRVEITIPNSQSATEKSYRHIVEALDLHGDNPNYGIDHVKEYRDDGSVVAYCPKIRVDMEPSKVLGALWLGGVITEHEMMASYRSLGMDSSHERLKSTKSIHRGFAR